MKKKAKYRPKPTHPWRRADYQGRLLAEERKRTGKASSPLDYRRLPHDLLELMKEEAD